MNKKNNIKLKIKVENDGKDQYIDYLPFHNNMIAISYEKTLSITKLSFYNMNNNSFELNFSIKFDKDYMYEGWQLHKSKNDKLYLIGYMREYRPAYEEIDDNNLGIFLFDITKKNITKLISFKYNNFILDKKGDKIYILNSEGIISYDLLTNISKQNTLKEKYENRETQMQHLLLIQNYLIIIDMWYIYKWLLDAMIITFVDKNLENIKSIYTDGFFTHDAFDGDYPYYVKISDNKYCVKFWDDKNNEIEVYEINILGNENILNDNEKFEDCCDKKYIFIKDEISKYCCSVYSLDERNFVINLSNKIFYLCDVENLQKKLKFIVDLSLFKSVNNEENEYRCYLISVKIKGPYYELIYYCYNNEILYISNK